MKIPNPCGITKRTAWSSSNSDCYRQLICWKRRNFWRSLDQ